MKQQMYIGGTAGNDTINGGPGNDYIDGGAGNDTIDGGAGNDIIEGGAGNDVLSGGAGEDLLLGRGGNDVLYGGPGRDSLVGDDGMDTFIIDAADIDYDVRGDYIDFGSPYPGPDKIVLRGFDFTQLVEGVNFFFDRDPIRTEDPVLYYYDDVLYYAPWGTNTDAMPFEVLTFKGTPPVLKVTDFILM